MYKKKEKKKKKKTILKYLLEYIVLIFVMLVNIIKYWPRTYQNENGNNSKVFDGSRLDIL